MLHGTEDLLINLVNRITCSQLTLVHYTEKLALIIYLAAILLLHCLLSNQTPPLLT